MQSEENIRQQKKRRKAIEQQDRTMGPMDMPFMLLVILLFSIGTIMMFSASYASAYTYQGSSTHFLVKQAAIGAAGIAIMLVVSRFNYQQFRWMSIGAMAVALVSLVLVLFIGKEGGGATRWIYLGPISYQPSEVAKLAVIMCFSMLLSQKKEKLKTFKYGILPFGIILGMICVLMYFQPHLSGMILIVVVGAALMFIAGVNYKWFFGVGAAGAAGIWVIMNKMAHSSARLRIWKNPWIDPSDKGYQIIQSLYAVGSGGFLGVGIGKSRQKYLYIPEPQNDFVFAIVCEELGFIGACVVLALFALLIIRGYWIAVKARDKFGSLLVAGVTTLFAAQVFLNVAVVTNLLPTTGVSLPFFSYGGSSLLIQLVEMGIVLSVSRQIPASKSG